MDRALPFSLLVALFLLTYSVASAKETSGAKEGLCTAAVRIDDICPTFQKVFDTFESYSERISELERKVELDSKKIVALELELKVVKTGFEKCSCDSDPDPIGPICSDPSLIAYFPFDGSYNDESCYKRHGKPVGGVTFSRSNYVSGGSAQFSGRGKVNVDLLSGYNWGDKFTVSVWFKRTATSGYQGIVSNGYGNLGSWEIRMGTEFSGQMLGGGVMTKKQ